MPLQPKLIVFDFDGVFTDNKVIVSQSGEESVVCNRSDGLAVDFLHVQNIPMLIISTETNGVVQARADKLRIPVYQGIAEKARLLRQLCDRKVISLDDVMYVGNDVNDVPAMRLCGMTVAPADAHDKAKHEATYITKSKGGEGVVRELCEILLGMGEDV